MTYLRTVITASAIVAGLLWVVGTPPATATAQRGDEPAPSSPWAEVVEPDFPFFSAVLDARNLGAGWPADNLTPRGLILNLGSGLWACFDTDLLRVAAVWAGNGVTPAGMAQGSYHRPSAKAPVGQDVLPQIVGTPWIATGLYPGWQAGPAVSAADPRPEPPDPRELARGPVDLASGVFQAVRLTDTGVVLEYEVSGIQVEERLTSHRATRFKNRGT